MEKKGFADTQAVNTGSIPVGLIFLEKLFLTVSWPVKQISENSDQYYPNYPLIIIIILVKFYR